MTRTKTRTTAAAAERSRARDEALLVPQGTGGGFDQGLAFAQGIAARGHRIIAPSRFGCLQSAFPEDALPAAQAQADLLDHPGIARLAVAGGSAGALSAAAFAILCPDRCARLVLLVPAMNLAGRDPVELTALQLALVGRVLAISAQDDRFGTAGTLIFPQGGHIWLGHGADMADAAVAFLCG